VFILQSNCQIVRKEQKQSSFYIDIVFNVVLCDVYAYTITVAIHASGTRKALLGPWLNNAEVYLTLLLEIKITQLQDIMHV
jgi:hypothetical protein